MLGIENIKSAGGRWHYDDLIQTEGGAAGSALETVRTGESVENSEKKIRTHDGRLLTLIVSTSLIKNHDDETTGAVELFHDISALRNMEEQLSRMKILALLGEMAASIAHEIRNPLGGVSGFAALLVRDLAQDKTKREMAQKIVAGVESINQTIETLLNFARNEEAHKQTIDLREYLERLRDGFAEEYGRPELSENISLKFEISEDTSVELDPQLFKQAIYNLIKNGIEAGEYKGKVNVGCKWVSHSISSDFPWAENAIEIFIEDNGPGIHDDDLSKIFSPFYSTKQNGTGLGLSIAWKIVKAHGGDIRAESKAGRGTRFTILLPARKR